MRRAWTVLAWVSLSPLVQAKETRPLPGFVIHFDFINSRQEADQLLEVAKEAGARVINVIPPAHVWERPETLAVLDRLLDRIQRANLKVLISRIDASYLPDAQGRRENFLYSRHLLENGRMADGSPTKTYFRLTVGVPGYAEWMEEETRYYANRYGKLPNLLGINLGPFSEPFSSERGGFLEYSSTTLRYELTQYSPHAAAVWHAWLRTHFGTVSAVNRSYQTSFTDIGQIPMPVSERDERFTHGNRAYFDLVRSINDWFIERYERCRDIWHTASGREDVPFILQFNALESEKLALARPGAAAFDLPDWILRADAVGLSIYLNNGYADHGQHAVTATVRLLGLAQTLGKSIFVMEGGVEAPRSVLDREQLAFFAAAATRLQPKTYIYEFLKDTINDTAMPNSGKIISSDNKVRPEALRTIRSLLQSIRYRNPERPVFYVVSAPYRCREGGSNAAAALAAFTAAGTLPIQWIPAGAMELLPYGQPAWQPKPIDTAQTDLLTQWLLRVPNNEDYPKLRQWADSLRDALTNP